jgi:hypothetical protein
MTTPSHKNAHRAGLRVFLSSSYFFGFGLLDFVGGALVGLWLINAELFRIRDDRCVRPMCWSPSDEAREHYITVPFPSPLVPISLHHHVMGGVHLRYVPYLSECRASGHFWGDERFVRIPNPGQTTTLPIVPTFHYCTSCPVVNTCLLCLEGSRQGQRFLSGSPQITVLVAQTRLPPRLPLELSVLGAHSHPLGDVLSSCLDLRQVTRSLVLYPCINLGPSLTNALSPPAFPFLLPGCIEMLGSSQPSRSHSTEPRFRLTQAVYVLPMLATLILLPRATRRVSWSLTPPPLAPPTPGMI